MIPIPEKNSARQRAQTQARVLHKGLQSYSDNFRGVFGTSPPFDDIFYRLHSIIEELDVDLFDDREYPHQRLTPKEELK